MTGTWTDTGSDYNYYVSLGSTYGYSLTNGILNLPGDNKFDQYYMSDTGGQADMGFSRIDTSNGILAEFEGIRAYLNKLHRYKIASPDFQPGRKIALRDGAFGNVDETCWTCAIPISGTLANVDVVTSSSLPVDATGLDSDAEYTAQHGPYLFYFKGSGGPGDGNGGKAVFWTGCQSHWGWWYGTGVSSSENCLQLRLGEDDYLLSITWDIFGTRYFYHRMGMGLDAGDMMRVSINNSDGLNGIYAFSTDTAGTYAPCIAPCTGGLFMNHFGDSALRLYMFAPPSNLQVVATGGQPVLTWTASTDASVTGYHVYRTQLVSGTATSPAIRITSTPITGTTYTDTDPTAGPGTGQWSYMVRGVRLETTGCGTFYNASLGVSQSIDMTNAPATLQIATAAALPDAYWNTSYKVTLTTTGGTPLNTWTVLSGTVPPGLSLGSNGTLSGTATKAGVYSFAAQATDALGQTDQRTFTITAQSNNTITLLAEASSYFYSTAPTRVQGTTESMVVSNAVGGTNCALVRYNTSGLNINNSFVSAKLRLFIDPGTIANCSALLQAALTADNVTGWNVVGTAKTNITGGVDNGSGYCRITSANHGLVNIFGKNVTTIAGVTGTNNANVNGLRTATIIDQNTFDLLTVPFNAAWVWTAANSTPSNGVCFNYTPPDNPSVPPAYATTFPVPNNYVDIDVTPLMAAALSNTSGKVSFRVFTQSTQSVYLGSAYSYAGAVPQLIIQTTNAPSINISSPTINPAFIYQNSGIRITASATAIPATAANLTTQWSQVSGPGTATFSTTTQPSTTVTFSAPGDYVLQLAANDGVLQSYKTVTIRVLTVPSGATASATGPTDHLMLRLPLDETSGTVAHDVSGVTPANSGSLITGSSASLPVWSSSGSRIGGALSFSGSGQQVVVPDSSTNLLDGTPQLTVSFWCYPTAINASSSFYNEMLCKTSSYEFKIRGGSTTNGSLYYNVGGKNLGTGVASIKLYTGNWYHIALVFDGTQSTNGKLYINGNPDSFGTIYSSGTIPMTSVPRISTTALRIGASGTADTVGYYGLIDEVRVYNRALTLAEVQDLYNAAPSDMGPKITAPASVSGSVGVSFALATTVTDDGLGAGPLTLGWSTVSGPGSAFFDNPTSATTNATCSLSGSFTLRLVANDGTISTFADVKATVTGQSFASWASGLSLSGPNASLTASPAGDGVSNLMKYALGLNPNQFCIKPTDGTNPGLPLVGTDATYLTLIYQKDTAKTDISYLVEAGTDMTSWSNSSVTEVATGTNGTILTIKASAPKGSNSREFIRLKVTKQ